MGQARNPAKRAIRIPKWKINNTLFSFGLQLFLTTNTVLCMALGGENTKNSKWDMPLSKIGTSGQYTIPLAIATRGIYFCNLDFPSSSESSRH
jgi:hypothetical protein